MESGWLMAPVIEVEIVMQITQVTNTRKIQTAHPSRALTVLVILIEISGSQTIIDLKGCRVGSAPCTVPGQVQFTISNFHGI